MIAGEKAFPRQVKEIDLVSSRVKHDYFGHSWHDEGVDWMLKSVLVENIAFRVAMIKGITTHFDHCQKSECVVRGRADVKYLLKCLSKFNLVGACVDHCGSLL